MRCCSDRSNSPSRSEVVSASGGPLPASTSARLTHSRSAVSVRSRSLETCVTLRSPTWQRRTASALNCGLNVLRFRLAMDHSQRIFARFEVSTKPGQDHIGRLPRPEGQDKTDVNELAQRALFGTDVGLPEGQWHETEARAFFDGIIAEAKSTLQFLIDEVPNDATIEVIETAITEIGRHAANLPPLQRAVRPPGQPIRGSALASTLPGLGACWACAPARSCACRGRSSARATRPDDRDRTPPRWSPSRGPTTDAPR